jgi:NAD(P)-dependent dehydrogenase (short-subunit alcohol dehydrogenase family)
VTNVVIGAGSGLGAEVARQLAPRGRMIVADRSVEGVEALASELGGAVEPMACDVTDAEQIEAVLAAAGDLDALVITAGLSGRQGDARTILDVNLRGTARVLAAAEPRLRAGSVGVCFASASGYRTPETPELVEVLIDPLAGDLYERVEALVPEVTSSHVAYSVSKRGVMVLVRSKAPLWGSKGARILSVSPSLVATPMSLGEEERNPVMKDIAKNSPVGRRGRPDEVANVVTFITSDLATYMTGSDVLVDGGIVGLDAAKMAQQLSGS